MMKKYVMIITIASAVLFSSSFFAPKFLGWSAISALLLQIFILAESKKVTLKNAFYSGLVWGGIVFGSQLYWIIHLLIKYSHYSKSVSLLCYCLICCSFAYVSGLWCASISFITRFCSGRAMNMAIGMLITLGYWIFLNRWGAYIMMSGDGYPLCNPLIPLCSYQWFLRIVCLASSWFVGQNYYAAQQPHLYTFLHVKPVVQMHDPFITSPSVLGQKIYHQLCDLYKKYKEIPGNRLMYCAPESFFPHPLNRLQELVPLWQSAMPPEAIFLLGAHYQEKGVFFQSVFFIHQSRIKKVYVKKHRVPFAEYIPKIWNLLGCTKSVLNSSGQQFGSYKNKAWNNVYCLDEKNLIIPQICSEFLWDHKTDCFRRWLKPDRVPAILWVVNDSWFPEYFNKILRLAGTLRAAWIGLPCIYVGHEVLENKFACRNL